MLLYEISMKIFQAHFKSFITLFNHLFCVHVFNVSRWGDNVPHSVSVEVRGEHKPGECGLCAKKIQCVLSVN